MMERRQFLTNTGIIAAGLTLAGTAKAAEKEMPKTNAPNPTLLQDAAVIKMLGKFAETASACALSGKICVQYCEEQLVAGKTDMATCLTASKQMAVICDTVADLAAMKSVRLAETLDVCTSACKACKDTCEEHKAHFKHGMHMECKSCAEHCDKMLAEIKKLKSALMKS